MNLDERQNARTSVDVEEERREHPQPPLAGSKFKSVFLLAAVLLLAGAVVLWGIAKRTRASITVARETQEMAVPTVAVVHPQRTSSPQEIVLPANIQPWTDAPIYARTNGYLKRWYADIGAHVKAGQLLAEIDTPEIDQQLEQARADLNTAEANYHLAEITATRYQDLLRTDSVSQQDADNAVGDYRAKQAMVQSAQSNVKRLQDLQSFQKIYAPFDGVITARKTDIGALINAGSNGPAQELFHIAATHTMRVYVNVPEVYSRAATPGMTADLTLAEFPGRRFTGRFVRTSQAIDLASRTLLAEIDLSNPTGELLPGAYAEVHFKVPAESSAYQLPVNTLIFRSEGLQIATVVEGNRVALVPVTLGRDFGNAVEIVAGLKGNEAVIVNPPDSLVSNAKVQIGEPASSGGEAP